ncbi:MAG: type II toxin-antitoxin system toxin DNA ADP-ribosyl transferase DarT [Nostochopsis sp.]
MHTLVYHITHIDNLPSIIKSGGLVANSRLKKTDYVDIAHGHIQDRRSITRVPCSVGGYLHDYIPFYFAPRSPMLYAIHRGKVQKYKDGQNKVIYLVSEAEIIASNKLNFAFTDGHAAVVALSEFYEKLDDLFNIDWKIMKETYWANTDEDNDRTRRRQAEFLVHQFCHWTLIQEVGVINSTIEKLVRKILQNFNVQTPVKINPSWYY